MRLSFSAMTKVKVHELKAKTAKELLKESMDGFELEGVHAVEPSA